jgi:hypothetical protein
MNFDPQQWDSRSEVSFSRMVYLRTTLIPRR